jgi:hypothetical protein
MSDFWSGERTTAPPIVELVSTENRKISVGLGAVLVAGETIQDNTITPVVRNWRTQQPIDPDPIVLPISYDAVLKTAAVRIDASLLPLREHAVLVITFNVTSPAGTETRAVYTGLIVNV